MMSPELGNRPIHDILPIDFLEKSAILQLSRTGKFPQLILNS